MVSTTPPEGLVDVKIIRTRTLTGLALEKGWITFRLEPRRRLIKCSDGGTREVQTFRCWKPNGDECELLVCGQCGDLCWGDIVDVMDAVVEGCRCCGAGLSTPGCVTPHTFGSCFRCPDSASLFDAERALTHNGHSNERGRSGASGEDARSPQTGPPQTSNGLVGSEVVS